MTNLVERVEVTRAPAAMWMMSRIAASLCGHWMRFCGQEQESVGWCSALIHSVHLDLGDRQTCTVVASAAPAGRLEGPVGRG